MRNHVLVLMTTVAILACGAIGAGAQAPVAPATDHEMGYGTPTTQPTQGRPTMQLQDTQNNDEDVLPFDDEDDQNDIYVMEPGPMSEMSGGMMGRGWHRDWHRGRAMIAPVMARIIFSLMDADGDGKLTLQEWQAAHERILKAMDTDHDGTVTFEEMQAFMRGRAGH